jgi:DNA repair protein RadA/Sms
MATKEKQIFFCKECGYESVKWLGQCPGCKQWNTLVEATAVKKGNKIVRDKAAAKPTLLSDISVDSQDRWSTKMKELDRVLGGGIVRGSLILVGGDPGIGKSTLLLQVCKNLSDDKNVLYISGEESLKQIKLRAMRLGEFKNPVSMLCETDLDVIKESIKEYKPDVVVVDSIQTMYNAEVGSAPGSVSQVRESTNVLMQLAKGMQITIFIVGHVTKEGVVAGPRVLEHMVDTVLYFEGDRYASYRILRGVKNRFGSTNEIGVFEMRETGLMEVSNPSEYMLSGMPEGASGSVIACSIEGTRPILVEIQALVSRTNFGIPRRTAAGTDYNRVNLLLAVLEKRAGLQIGDCDAYVNIAGGIKITEPAMDLGIVMSVASSYKNKVIDNSTVVFGEVGLAGEVRSVSLAKERIAEAQKLGFKKCIIPKSSLEALDNSFVKNLKGIELIGIRNVAEAIALI